jgi:hypothetical protein
MKFGAQERFVTLFTGFSLLSGAAFAEGKNWAAPGAPAAPLLSKEACDTVYPFAVKERDDGQAQRDYVDNQYDYYLSVAQKIYDKLANGLVYLKKKNANFSAVKVKGALTEDEREIVKKNADNDVKGAFFDVGYQFCPAGSVAFSRPEDDQFRAFTTCRPNADWKQVNSYPPYGVQVNGAEFFFDDSLNPTIKFNFTGSDHVFGSSDEADFDYKVGKNTYKAAPFSDAKSATFTFDQFTVDSILKAIWPYDGAPAKSLRPDQVLKTILAGKHCEMEAPDYKPNTVTKVKVLDERTAPAAGSGGKTSGTTVKPK